MSKYTSEVICTQHPELEGLRWQSNMKCIKCDAQRVADRLREKRRNNPEFRAAEIAKRKERYHSDPAFREKELGRARRRNAARRARAQTT